MTLSEERAGEIHDFIGNCIAVVHIPEFEDAMREFLSPLDDETFDLLVNEINPVVFNSFGASTAGNPCIPCNEGMSSRPLRDGAHWIPYIVIGGGFMEQSPEGRVGEIAHLVAGRDDPYHTTPRAEAEVTADNLARGWGFAEEIDRSFGYNPNSSFRSVLLRSPAGGRWEVSGSSGCRGANPRLEPVVPK